MSEQKGYAYVAAKARHELLQAEITWHPYLVRKGHAKERLPVLDGDLLVPLFSGRQSIMNMLKIDADGDRRIYESGLSAGVSHTLGSGPERWYVVDYVDALSVYRALKQRYQNARVICTLTEENRQRFLTEEFGFAPDLPANEIHCERGLDALADEVLKFRRLTDSWKNLQEEA